MTTLQIIMEVKTLLATEHHWTQLAWSRDESHRICNLMSDKACSWCLLGAIRHICKKNNLSSDQTLDVIKLIDNHIPNMTGSIVLWNDRPGRTHGDVLRLLDNIIMSL